MCRCGPLARRRRREGQTARNTTRERPGGGDPERAPFAGGKVQRKRPFGRFGVNPAPHLLYNWPAGGENSTGGELPPRACPARAAEGEVRGGVVRPE